MHTLYYYKWNAGRADMCMVDGWDKHPDIRLIHIRYSLVDETALIQKILLFSNVSIMGGTLEPFNGRMMLYDSKKKSYFSILKFSSFFVRFNIFMERNNLFREIRSRNSIRSWLMVKGSKNPSNDYYSFCLWNHSTLSTIN